MGQNDFYVGIYEDRYLAHSKGPWKKGHKYIKKIGNIYYYAKKSNEFSKSSKEDFAEAKRIRGDLGYNETERLDGRSTGYNKLKNLYSNNYIKTRNSANKNHRLSSTYHDMAVREAQSIFGKRGGEIVAKIMEKVARPKKKKYETVKSWYGSDNKYYEVKLPKNKKTKKKLKGKTKITISSNLYPSGTKKIYYK